MHRVDVQTFNDIFDRDLSYLPLFWKGWVPSERCFMADPLLAPAWTWGAVRIKGCFPGTGSPTRPAHYRITRGGGLADYIARPGLRTGLVAAPGPGVEKLFGRRAAGVGARFITPRAPP